MALKRATEIPTIDCVLVVITQKNGEISYALDTASQVGVEPNIETTDAVQLIIKGVLKAQKPAQNTITGNTITLTDNVFTPEIVQIMQGGTITYDTEDTTKVVGYKPPVAGSKEVLEPFTLTTYSAQYDASGQIVQYEKTDYPNCTGQPVAFSTEDGVFRAPEYTIVSAPKKGESPYDMTYIKELPVVS